MLTLSLRRTPGWPSPYGKGGAFVPLPNRMRWLHPDALQSLLAFTDVLAFTDCYRSPSSSLLALQTQRGAARPGRSAHNFGLAVDLDVASCLRMTGWTKADLDKAMEQAGWLCFRADHEDASESWHYTHGATEHGSAGVEAAIQRVYGGQLGMGVREAQAYLTRAGMYHGEIDGDAGPLTRSALQHFQEAWKLAEDGVLGPETQRLIAVICAAPDVS